MASRIDTGIRVVSVKLQQFVIDEIHSHMDKTDLSWDDTVQLYIRLGIGTKKVDSLIEEVIDWFDITTKEDLAYAENEIKDELDEVKTKLDNLETSINNCRIAILSTQK